MAAQNGASRGRAQAADEALASIAESAAASRVAEFLIAGFERCELEGRPLSELQKVDLLATALTAFDGYREGVGLHVGLHRTLTELAHQDVGKPAPGTRPRGRQRLEAVEPAREAGGGRA
jgi:hypothetical protein